MLFEVKLSTFGCEDISSEVTNKKSMIYQDNILHWKSFRKVIIGTKNPLFLPGNFFEVTFNRFVILQTQLDGVIDLTPYVTEFKTIASGV